MLKTLPPKRDAQALLDATPAHSAEAERGVIGSILLDPRVCDDVAAVLRADDFYSPAYKRIYELALAIHNEGKAVDATLLIERLKASNEFEMFGGMSLLLDVAEGAPTAANAVWYAQSIRDNATARKVKHACLDGAAVADDRTIPAAEKLDRVAQSILAICEDGQTTQAVTLSTALSEAVQALSDRIENGVPSGLSTGFSAVDRMLGGLRAGELVIVAGRPGAGKTALGIGVATSIAKTGAGVLVVSLEMSRRELAERMLSAAAGVDGELIRNAKLDRDQRRRIIDAQAQLDGLPFEIDDAPSRTALQITSAARRLKRQGRLRLLVVDYLGLIEPENQRDPRQEQVAKVARRLKKAARELAVPILCLAQLNRETEKGGDHRPKLANLRESGAIEQDADAVLFVHRPEMYAPDDADLFGKAEVIIAKNRNGSTGIVPLVWNGPTTSFKPVMHVTPWTGDELF